MRKFTNAEAWAQVGRELGLIYRSHPWETGDWWVAGDDLPRGVRLAIVQAPDWTGAPYETCKQWGRVARKFPPRCRYLHHCDISHHQEVAMLPDELAGPLLEQAEREHWIVNRLRVEVRRRRFRASTGKLAGHASAGAPTAPANMSICLRRRSIRACEPG